LGTVRARNASLGLSRSYSAAGDLQEAEAAIKKAIDLAPSTGFVDVTLARISPATGPPAEALAAFRGKIDLAFDSLARAYLLRATAFPISRGFQRATPAGRSTLATLSRKMGPCR